MEIHKPEVLNRKPGIPLKINTHFALLYFTKKIPDILCNENEHSAKAIISLCLVLKIGFG